MSNLSLPSRIWLSPPHLGDEERGFVQDAFDSNWIAPLGPQVESFEKELAQVTSVRDAAAVSSGTAAIHLALRILGVGSGDWVMCQSLTFAGTANPICYVGATPVFVGSERASWNMDPEALRTAIRKGVKRGKRPKAVIPVHLYGMPAMMDEILAVAAEYEIPVIEDAAEALGSRLGGRPCGSFGDMAVLSFNGNKIITTSGGGALLSNDTKWIEQARFLASQARDHAPHYEHSTVGFNYRLSNVLAAIGRGQLRVLDQRVEARRANFDRYCAFFSSRGVVSMLAEPHEGVRSNRWLTTVLFDLGVSASRARDRVMRRCAESNIEVRPIWKPMHLQPVFRDTLYVGDDFAEQVFGRGLCLPSGSSLGDSEFARIFDTLASALDEVSP